MQHHHKKHHHDKDAQFEVEIGKAPEKTEEKADSPKEKADAKADEKEPEAAEQTTEKKHHHKHHHHKAKEAESLAEKTTTRDGCTSLGCPEGSAAKNLSFTTEEAISGQPITGKFIDSATAGNWAQVGNSTIAQKADGSNPACTSLGCDTDTNAKYTVPKTHDEVTYPTG